MGWFVNYSYADLDSVKLLQAQAKLIEIRNEYAPDARTAIFSITTNYNNGELVFKGETTEPQAYDTLVKYSKTVNGSNVSGVTLLPSAELSNTIYGVATLSVCNNKSQPQHRAEMVTQMTMGTPVQVLQKKNNWLLVRTPDDYLSWTEPMGIALMTQAEMDQWRKANKLIFTDDFGHIVSVPSNKGAIVSDIVKGCIIEYNGKTKGFYNVTLPDKRRGYIDINAAMDYNVWVKRPKTVKDILIDAERLIGTPYLWGGTSIKGVDCSGLVKVAFFLNGIILPRDASQQAKIGNPIDVMTEGKLDLKKCLNNLQAGDLLYFTSTPDKVGTPLANITHVAIYISNGTFIHASGRVRVNSLKPDDTNYAAHQAQTMVGACRIISSSTLAPVEPY